MLNEYESNMHYEVHTKLAFNIYEFHTTMVKLKLAEVRDYFLYEIMEVSISCIP